MRPRVLHGERLRAGADVKYLRCSRNPADEPAGSDSPPWQALDSVGLTVYSRCDQWISPVAEKNSESPLCTTIPLSVQT
jgi:hypothetical protein